MTLFLVGGGIMDNPTGEAFDLSNRALADMLFDMDAATWREHQPPEEKLADEELIRLGVPRARDLEEWFSEEYLPEPLAIIHSLQIAHLKMRMGAVPWYKRMFVIAWYHLERWL